MISWFRSAFSGVQPERFGVPYEAEIDGESNLLRAAGLVLERVTDDLVNTGTGLVLTDDRGHILDRRAPDGWLRRWLDHIELAPGFYYDEPHAGTNAIGTALVVGRPFLVHGVEHFSDALARLVTVAAPVREPRTRRVLGVVALSSQVEDADGLMLPFVRRTASEVAQRLFDGHSEHDRALHDHFVTARRRSRGPLVVASAGTMLANPQAAQRLRPGDHELLWDWVSRALVDPAAVPGPVVLISGTWMVKSLHEVRDGGVVAGATVRFELLPASEAAAAAGSGPLGSDRPRFGWGSVTAAEMRVAELVAQALTNREIASQLYLSSHTVSFHIRQMYRKLEISSRVELTRRLLEDHRSGRAT